MAVDLTQTKTHLNITDDDEDDELEFFVDAANEWVATQVDDEDLTKYSVQMGTLELIRHWWESQRGPAASEVLEDGSLGLLGFAIPNRVKELLGPWLTGSAPAAAVGSFPDAADWPDPVECW